MVLPEAVGWILERLAAAGHEAYAVGGCVRDCLRGVEPKDWDIATSAKPAETAVLFPRTVETGAAHGTVTVLTHGAAFEVTTYRVDGPYSDGRHPDAVTFAGSIADDLSRRDFTINAMAYHPRQGLADPFGGQDDLARGLIRAVGDPERRFTEDALRMMRALRFAGQLGFGVAPNTLAAVARCAEGLGQVSAERIRDELLKLLLSPCPLKALLLQETGLLAHMPVGGYPYDLPRAINFIAAYPREAKDAASVLALFFCEAADIAPHLRGLRLDNRTARDAKEYHRRLPASVWPDVVTAKKALGELTPRRFFNLLALQTVVTPERAGALAQTRRSAEEILRRGDALTLKDLAVNGADLVALGFPPGRAVGDGLRRLLEFVWENPAANSRGELSALAAGFLRCL